MLQSQVHTLSTTWLVTNREVLVTSLRKGKEADHCHGQGGGKGGEGRGAQGKEQAATLLTTPGPWECFQTGPAEPDVRKKEAALIQNCFRYKYWLERHPTQWSCSQIESRFGEGCVGS